MEENRKNTIEQGLSKTLPCEEEPFVEWGGWLNEFLWICAGANRRILRQCRTEYAKYAGIGGTILFTALMAMISGGYALYFVFDNHYVALAFGIFWGLLIFNLDRFIVNTMYSDGKVTISRQEFTSGLPRIIMAIFLGVVISTPLEMKIFEERINTQLIKINTERTNQTIALGQEGNVSAKDDLQKLWIQKSQIENEKQKLDEQKYKLEEELDKANNDLKKEGEGSALSGKVGRGPIYKEKEEYRNSKQQQLSRWTEEHRTDYDRINSDLTQISNQIVFFQSQVNERNAQIEEDVKKANEEDGFCARYEAFSDLKAENPSLAIVSLVIMILFVIIETAPTFFKMMIASGPYDDYLRAEMRRARAVSDMRISEINADFQISTQSSVERIEAEVAGNKKLMEQVAIAQAELLQTAIDKWKEEELVKINENPIIKTRRMLR